MALTPKQAYALSRTYTEDTAEEFGAVKGAPCEIAGITAITGGHRITFSWTNTAGETRTDYMDVMNGEKGEKGDDGDTGVGIERIHQVNDTIIIYYTDGTSSDPIEIPTVPGEDGFSPEITVAQSTSDTYKLHIKTADDEFDTPNLRGGGAGIDMEVVDEVLVFSED